MLHSYAIQSMEPVKVHLNATHLFKHLCYIITVR